MVDGAHRCDRANMNWIEGDFREGYVAAGHRKNENCAEQPTVEFSAPTLAGSNRLPVLSVESM
jgi:hypothetical protein